jgi:hypothetical protein
MATPQPTSSIWRTIVAVAWSFFGVRKRSGWDEDMARITPLQLMAVGLGAVFVLVLVLIALVNWVVA